MQAAGGLAILPFVVTPVFAQDCRLALVLALDVSISVDLAEDRQQREGLAHALLAPEVADAFLAGDPVAVYVFEWAGQHYQADLSQGWHLIEDGNDLTLLSDALVASRRNSINDFTAVGAALAHASTALAEGPACSARTIDVSGDGQNNDGPPPESIYRRAALVGVTVNALVIGGGMGTTEWVADWFRTHVLQGPGAFVMVADSYEDYERAMRLKLLRELDQRTVSGQGPDEDAG